jgi:hypothetical protein
MLNHGIVVLLIDFFMIASGLMALTSTKQFPVGSGCAIAPNWSFGKRGACFGKPFLPFGKKLLPFQQKNVAFRTLARVSKCLLAK